MKRSHVAHRRRRRVRGLPARPARQARRPRHRTSSARRSRQLHGHGARPDRPPDGYCAVTDATITHDLVLRDDAGADVSGTSIGHDVRLRGTMPEQASWTRPSATTSSPSATESGADVFETTVGHDIVALGEDSGFDIAGVDDRPRRPAARPCRRNACRAPHHRPRLLRVEAADGADRADRAGHARRPREHRSRLRDRRLARLPFVFDGLCAVNVAHDFSITNRSVTLGIGLGTICARNGQPANTIGRDLVVTGNTALAGVFGPSALIVGANHVGRDLVFSNNTAVPAAASRCPGTSSVATLAAPRTTRRSRSTRRTPPGARTPAADSRLRGTLGSSGSLAIALGRQRESGGSHVRHQRHRPRAFDRVVPGRARAAAAESPVSRLAEDASPSSLVTRPGCAAWRAPF